MELRDTALICDLRSYSQTHHHTYYAILGNNKKANYGIHTQQRK